MEYIYIPTSSLNFNNIFSTESISPKVFYTNRRFGYSRFYLSEPNKFENCLLGYTKIPEFPSINKDLEEYSFILKVPIENISEYNSIGNDKEIRVYKLLETIYLNTNCEFIFSSKKEMDIVVSKSLQSLETKFVEKYLSSFKTLNDYPKSESYSSRIDIKEEDKLFDNESLIERDVKINKLKGFLYSYFIGALLDSSDGTNDVLNTFRELKNIYASFSNALPDDESEKNYKTNKYSQKNKVSYSKKDAEFLNRAYGELREIITKIKTEINDNIVEDSIDDIIESKLSGLDLKTNIRDFIEDCKKITPYNHSFYSQLEFWIQKENPDNFNLLFDGLIQRIDALASSKGFYYKKPREIKDEIIKIFEQVERKLQDYSYKNIAKEDIPDFNKIIINDLLITNIISEGINKDAFMSVINYIAGLTKISKPEDILENRANILQNIGKKFGEFYPDWQNSKERDYLIGLLKVASGKGYDFDLKDTTDELLMNIAAFVLKSEKIEELDDYLKRNKIPNKSIALGLWGVSFGLSSLPRTYYSILEKSQTTKTLKELDRFIFKNLLNKNIVLSSVTNSVDTTGSAGINFEKENVEDGKEKKQDNEKADIDYEKYLMDIFAKDKKFKKSEDILLCFNKAISTIKRYPDLKDSQLIILLNEELEKQLKTLEGIAKKTAQSIIKKADLESLIKLI